MPYGNKMPKKMGCSGGGPNMYKVGSKEKNSPMNFSDKAMMYMKKMPAMYGKPKMDGDPVKKEKLTERVKKETGKVTSSEAAGMRKAISSLKEDTVGQTSNMNARTTETTKQFGNRSKKTYDKKFGEGAASKRKYDRSKSAAKKALGPNPTRAEVEAFKKKFPKMYGKKK